MTSTVALMLGDAAPERQLVGDETGALGGEAFSV
jgi:hypothetical protein